MALVKYKTSAKGFKEMVMDFIHNYNSASERVYHNSSSGTFLTVYFSPITSEMFLSVSFLFSSIFLSMPTIPTARVFPAYMTTKEKKKHTIKLNTDNMSQRTRKDKNKQKKSRRELFMVSCCYGT